MPLTRRQALVLAGAAFVAAPVLGHTPYSQWVVYRQKHLLVGAHRGDARTYELAKNVVAGLQRELPAAQARVARGPRPQRIASLMGTGQLSLAVLSEDEAVRMKNAEGAFADYPPTPTEALADLGGAYRVIAAPDFPQEHAYLVTRAIAAAGLGTFPHQSLLALHPGAIRYWDDPH